jgi:histidinol-phosphate aminotransferase
MSLSRRLFVRSLGVAGATALSARSGWESALAQDVATPVKPTGPPPIKLDANENPYGPSPAVAKAVAEALAKSGNRYPRNTQDLIDALAKHHEVPKDNILIAAGSGELLRVAIPAFTGPTRALVAPLPTFETCTGAARRMNFPVRELVVDKALRLDLAGLDDAAGGAGLLYLCNPNNPTGTVVPTKEIAAICDRLAARSPETFVLLDEAYHHFVADKSYETMIPRAVKDRRVVVTRTFSKIYGLAGFRVGYGLCPPDVAAACLKVKNAFDVTQSALDAALASLDAGDEVARRRAETSAGRERLASCRLGTHAEPSRLGAQAAPARVPPRPGWRRTLPRSSPSNSRRSRSPNSLR